MRALFIALVAGACTYSPARVESPCVPQDGRASFEISPELIRDVWLPPGEPVEFAVSVRRSDCRPPRIEVGSHPDWAQVDIGGVIGAGVSSVDIVVDAMTAGETRRGTVVLYDARDSRIRGQVTLELRTILLDEVHIGMSDQGCPRPGATGCDFVGATGLVDAANAHGAGGARMFLHGDAGERAFYGTAGLPGDTWVSGAPDASVDDVVLVCGRHQNPVVLAGDNIRLQGVTIKLEANCGSAVWASDDVATRGHLIENIVGAFVTPEEFGNNGLQEPFAVGDDSTVRNSFFWGFHEGMIDLRGTRRVRVVGNTVVTFQQVEGWPDYRDMAFVWGQDSTDALVANNVFVVMSARAPVLARANHGTVGLRLIGNAAEGVEAVVVGLDPLDGSSEVRDNRLAETLDLLAPTEPRFLADTSQISAVGIGIEGVSLDGVTGSGWSLPGAFRMRVELGLPRPDVVRVGSEPGACGGESCDTWQEMTHEVQWALWRAWPGARVEVYPSDVSYAGGVRVSWPVTLSGMGGQPDEVVLRTSGDTDGDLLLSSTVGDGSGLVILQAVHAGPVVVENLTVRAETAGTVYAVLVEPPAWPAFRNGTHVFRRLRIESDDNTARSGFALGGGVLVRDSLVVGDYASCAIFGPREHQGVETPHTTNWVVNLTCRLRHSGPDGAFQVANAVDSVLVNIVASTDQPAPIFRAQALLIATDQWAPQPVVGLVAGASTYSGFSMETDGFDPDLAPGVDIDVVSLPAGTPLFVADDDSHLVTAAPMDAGIDPANHGFAAGVSLDGIDRHGRDIDQGCYEQGL